MEFALDLAQVVRYSVSGKCKRLIALYVMEITKGAFDMVEFMQSETIKNLMKAFAGESQARNRYGIFSGVARKEGHQYLGFIFNETADNEKEHAKVLYNALVNHGGGGFAVQVNTEYPVALGDTLACLRAAQSGEREEAELAYPAFAQKATEEGYADIARIFSNLVIVEKAHMERYKMYADLLESQSLYTKPQGVTWFCTNCGYHTNATSAPDTCPLCAHPKGYFKVI